MANHTYFMKKALELAEQALAAGEFPVGCVMVAEDIIVSDGSRQHSHSQANEIDHAEMIALRRLLRNSPEISPSAITVYSTMEPCLMCYSTMLISSINSFVYGYEDAMGGGTSLSLGQLPPLYQAMQPIITAHVLRQESLLLFQDFFRNPQTNYLQDTYLASYTLKQ